MGNRSLFSPFASSVNPYAARNIGRLFRRPDSIEINPEYLQLLQSGVEPSPEMLMTTPPFKGGTSAKAANAKFLSDLVQAQFGSNLATSKEKELIPLKYEAEIKQAKTLSDFQRKQKREIEEEELSNIGTARGQVLGSLPTEQLSRIIPQGTTFKSPVEQDRFYQAQVGGNIPISKATFETDPNVIAGRIGEEAGKRFIDLGSGFKYDPITGEFIQGGRYENIQEQVPFDTGKIQPVVDPVTGEFTDKYTTVKELKLQSRPQYFPGRVGQMTATQKALDDIPKESGAEVKGNLLSTDVGPRHIGPNLRSLTPPLNTTLQQPPPTQPNFWQRLNNNIIPEEFRNQFSIKKKEKQPEKSTSKAYPLEHLIEAYKLDKDQKEDFEFFVQNYTKKQGNYPSLEEARAYIRTLIDKKK